MRFAIDLLALLVTKAALVGLRLTALYIIASKADPAIFGPVALAFTVVEIARYIADWGTDTLAIREFRYPEEGYAQAILHWIVRVRIVSGIVALALSFALISVFCAALPLAQKLAIAAMSVTSLWVTSGVNWLQNRQSLPRVALVVALIGACSFAGQLWGAWQHWRITGQLLILFGFEVVISVAVWQNCLHGTRGMAAKSRPRFRQWFVSSTPIALSAILAISYSRVDQFYLKFFASADLLGDFSLSARLTEPFLFLGSALSLTLYSRVSAVAFENAPSAVSKMKHQIRSWIGGVAMSAVLFAATIAVLGSLVLRWHFQRYQWAPFFLIVCCAAMIGRLVNLTLGAFIQALNGFTYILRVNLINAATYVSLTLLIGFALGPVASVTGVAAGEFLATLMHSRSLRIKFREWAGAIEKQADDQSTQGCVST